MADSKSSTKARTADLQLIRDLIKAAEADTVYRDLYLQRAAERLELLLSRAEYERLKAQPATLEQLTQETREAVRRQNWAKVQELTASASSLRNMLADKQSELKLAEEVYGAAEVLVDPFSSALDVLLGKTSQVKAALRSEAVTALSALEKADRDWGSFYAGRRGYFAGLSIAMSEPAKGKATKDDIGQLQQRAVEAAERGNMDELQRIASVIPAKVSLFFSRIMKNRCAGYAP